MAHINEFGEIIREGNEETELIDYITFIMMEIQEGKGKDITPEFAEVLTERLHVLIEKMKYLEPAKKPWELTAEQQKKIDEQAAIESAKATTEGKEGEIELSQFMIE